MATHSLAEITARTQISGRWNNFIPHHFHPSQRKRSKAQDTGESPEVGLPEERTQHWPNPRRREAPSSMAWAWASAFTEEESSDRSLPPASAQARGADSGWHTQTSEDQTDHKKPGEVAISALRTVSKQHRRDPGIRPSDRLKEAQCHHRLSAALPAP